MRHRLQQVAIPISYRDSIRAAFIQAAIVVVLGALMLDFGETLRVSLIVLPLFWGWIFVAMYRRPEKPTPTDLIVIRWGTIPLVIGVRIVVGLVWSWRGLA
jgi:positive regulator of sigma E activity